MASVLNACRAGTLTDPKLNNDLRAPLWGGGGGGVGSRGINLIITFTSNTAHSINCGASNYN